MAEPAAAPDHPGERQPDPEAARRANVVNLLMTIAEATGVAVSELAARPRCAGALRRADALYTALTAATEIARSYVLEQSVLEAYGDQRYAQGVADCKAARCRLGAVPDPR